MIRKAAITFVLVIIASAIPACFAVSLLGMNMDTHNGGPDSYETHLVHMQELTIVVTQEVAAISLALIGALLAFAFLAASTVAVIMPASRDRTPWHLSLVELLPKPSWIIWLHLLVRSPSFVPLA